MQAVIQPLPVAVLIMKQSGRRLTTGSLHNKDFGKRVVPTKVKRRTENTTIIIARLISMSLVLAASVAALPYRADAKESQRSQHATSDIEAASIPATSKPV